MWRFQASRLAESAKPLDIFEGASGQICFRRVN